MTERKAASEFTHAGATDRVLETLPFEDERDFEEASRGFIAPLPEGHVLKPNGDFVFDPARLDFAKGREAGAGDGQPQPLAPGPAGRRGWSVQGLRADLPGPRLRHLEPDRDRGRQRGHRGRSADLGRDGESGARSLLRAPPEEAGRRRDPLPQPRRPLRRRARSGRRGRRHRRPGEGDRPRGIPRSRGLRERHGRHRDDPARDVPVRGPARPGRPGHGRDRPRLRGFARHGDADPADRRNHREQLAHGHRRPRLSTSCSPRTPRRRPRCTGTSRN